MLNAQGGPQIPHASIRRPEQWGSCTTGKYLPWINSNQSKLQLLSETIGGRAVLLWGTQIHNAALES
jgi:hypothetical protein